MEGAPRFWIMSQDPALSLSGSHAKASPEEEVEQLFVEVRDDLYRYLVTLGLTTEEAQESAQEAFLRLFAARIKGESIENPRGWIFRVGHNIAVRLRTRERIYQPLTAGVEQRLVDPQNNPELSAIEREQTVRFQEAVENLSPQQQECLYLRAEGFRYREIADIMEISDSSVGEFLRRAITRLKKALHA
jgi:RNA polymerase sigma-70 factor, ECF subfamily